MSAARESRRAGKGDNFIRIASSRIANWVRNKLSGEQISDAGCTYRAFKRECIENLKFFKGMHRFLPTLFKIEGFTVTEIAVTNNPRFAGQSHYGVWNRLFASFYDLLAVRWMKKRMFRYQVAERINCSGCRARTAAAAVHRSWRRITLSETLSRMTSLVFQSRAMVMARAAVPARSGTTGCSRSIMLTTMPARAAGGELPEPDINQREQKVAKQQVQVERRELSGFQPQRLIGQHGAEARKTRFTLPRTAGQTWPAASP